MSKQAVIAANTPRSTKVVRADFLKKLQAKLESLGKRNLYWLRKGTYESTVAPWFASSDEVAENPSAYQKSNAQFEAIKKRVKAYQAWSSFIRFFIRLLSFNSISHDLELLCYFHYRSLYQSLSWKNSDLKPRTLWSSEIDAFRSENLNDGRDFHPARDIKFLSRGSMLYSSMKTLQDSLSELKIDLTKVLDSLADDLSFLDIEASDPELIAQVDDNYRLIIAERGLIFNKIHNAQELISVLSFLPKRYRVGFATLCLAAITNLKELAEVLPSLPKNAQFNFAVKCRNKITTADDLDALFLVGIFSESSFDRYAFLERCSDSIRRAYYHANIKSIDDLVRVTRDALPASRVAFSESFLSLIKNRFDLAKIIAWLPEFLKLEFANRAPCLAKIQNGRELAEFMAGDLLSPTSKLAFAEYCVDKIQNLDELIVVIRALPKGHYRWNFANKEACLAKINNGSQLAAVLMSLEASSHESLYFVQNKQCLSKIQNGHELVLILSHLPESSQLSFAQNSLTKIQNISELIAVLEKLAKISHLDFAKSCLTKIQNVKELAAVLKVLIKSYTRQSILELITSCITKIKNERELALVLWYLPVDAQLAFANRCLTSIHTITGFITVLNQLKSSVGDFLGFAESFRDKIRTISELDRILMLNKLNLITTAQKIAFVEGCTPNVRGDYFIREEIYGRSLFDDPIARQMISLQELDPNLFLFAAAADPLRESDFDYLLLHPLCSVDALSSSAMSLSAHIEKQSALSPTLKDSRIAKVKVHQERLRLKNASQYLGINLSSIEEPIASFTANLAEPDAVGAWVIEGVKAETIKRFRQLIEWLNTQEALEPYKLKFKKLEENLSIRRATIAPDLLMDLECFVANLDLYLKRRKPALTETETARQQEDLASCLYAVDQLELCSEGARASLKNMTRSLSSNAQLSAAVDVEMDRSLRMFVLQTAISPGNEVHTSKDRALLRLGLKLKPSFDPYRLPISPVYLEAIAADMAGQLRPKVLVSKTAAYLESILFPELQLSNQGVFDALLRDWGVLCTTGLMNSTATDNPTKIIDVLCFISGITRMQAATLYENYGEGNGDQTLSITLTPEKLQQLFWNLLRAKGVITMTSDEVLAVEARIWKLLTTEDKFSAADDIFWMNLLKAPNALGWIKSVINSHKPEEQDQIKLAALLRSLDASSPNLFQRLVADPYSSDWLMHCYFSPRFVRETVGEDEVITLKKLYFLEIEGQGPRALSAVLDQLASNETLMHIQLEEAFLQKGNLLFWLAVLNRDESRKTTLKSILNFLAKRDEVYRFDNLPSVLREMITKGEPGEQAIAVSFLEARCKEQEELELWNCYWCTTCYLKDPELNLNAKRLESLKDPENIGAVLYLAKSREALVQKIRASIETISASLGLTGKAHWSNISRRILMNIDKHCTAEEVLQPSPAAPALGPVRAHEVAAPRFT